MCLNGLWTALHGRVHACARWSARLILARYRRSQRLRSHHDMGGLPAGPIERSEHDYAHWEKRVDALMVLLSAPERRLLRVDELRRQIEGLRPDAYDAMSYYERWIAAITRVLLESGGPPPVQQHAGESEKPTAE